MNVRKKTVFLTLVLALAIFGGASHADVSIKIVIVNPSESEEKDIPVKYSLPSGLKREDIKDSGELKIEYDMKESIYCVAGTFKLAPKESKVLKVTVSDIWRIPRSDFDEAEKMLEGAVAALKDSDKKELIESVAKEMEQKLEKLYSQQEELVPDIEKRMQRYFADLQKMRAIKEDIFSIERLAGISEDKTKKDQADTVKIVIAAENPEPQEVTTAVKYFIPRDVKLENIVDLDDFDIKYDIDKGRPYFEKRVTFAPNEKKVWNITVNNAWKVPDKELSYYVDEASKTKEGFAYSKYKEFAASIFAEIQKNADLIRASQAGARSVDEMIAVYRENQARFEDIKEALIRMQNLVSKDWLKKHNVLRDIKLLENVKQISDVLMKKVLKEGKISLIKVIVGVILFVMFITMIASIAWLKRIKTDEKKEMKNIINDKKENEGS
jgi:hypothetical protein